MKKILIILFCLLMVGCGKENNQIVVTPPPNPEPKEEIMYTEKEAQNRLKEIADEVYQKNKYLNYTKKDGKYFISLKELRDNLKYDTKKIDNLDGLVCDENETGIAIDIDNLEKVDYIGNPVITLMLCNPPKRNDTEEQNN